MPTTIAPLHLESYTRFLRPAAPAVLALIVTTGLRAAAASLAVPNGSFESPTPPPGFPATPQVDVWQKSPQPVWFDPATLGITWDQLSGVFPNTPAGSGDHIENVDGSQAAYLFALPQVALFQTIPDTTYQVGMSYHLTVGVLGAGGITEGSAFSIGLFYDDPTAGRVRLATTDITYSSALFPSANRLVDFRVDLDPVQAGDAWAGLPIGIDLMSTAGVGAGYRDVDLVRVEAVPEPSPLALVGLGAALWVASRAGTRRRDGAEGPQRVAE